MDQCDSKVNLAKYMGLVTYISWSIDFALYHCHRLKLFLYTKKWCRPGVFVSLQALALVEVVQKINVFILIISNSRQIQSYLHAYCYRKIKNALFCLFFRWQQVKTQVMNL